MGLSTAKRNIGKVGASLGIFQGTAWSLLSLLAIITHYWQPEIAEATSYIKTLTALLYYKFIVDDGTWNGITFILPPNNFIVLMWIYFVLSVVWVVLSIDQFTAIQYNRKRQALVMRLWGMFTFFISLIDLAFVVLLAADYTACQSSKTTILTITAYYCYLSTGIVMTVVARGYTLWVINIVFAILLMKQSSDVTEDTNSTESLYSTIPRAKLGNRFANPLTRQM